MITPKLGLRVRVSARESLVGKIVHIENEHVVKVKLESMEEPVTVAVARLELA